MLAWRSQPNHRLIQVPNDFSSTAIEVFVSRDGGPGNDPPPGLNEVQFGLDPIGSR